MSPPVPDRGFVSANIHCIGKAWRPSAPARRPNPVPGSQTAREQFRLDALLTANAKYVATASAYAFGPVPPWKGGYHQRENMRFGLPRLPARGLPAPNR